MMNALPRPILMLTKLLKAFTLAFVMVMPATGNAQNPQVFNTYYKNCEAALAKADWGQVGNFCDAAKNEALRIGNQNLVGDIADLMGRAFGANGRYKDAESYYLVALSIREQNAANVKNGAALLASTQNNLAGLYDATGRTADADALYKKSLALFEGAYGKDSPQVAMALTNVATMSKKMGMLDEAEQLYLRAIKIYNVKDPASLPLAITYGSLANLYAQKENFGEALKYMAGSLAIRNKLLPENHPLIAETLNDFGSLQLQMKNFDEAVTTFEDALEMRKIALPKGHPAFGQSYVNLGRGYFGVGRYADAEKALREGVKLQEIVYGKKSSQATYAIDQLAKVLRATNHNKEAASLEKKAASIRATLG